MELQGKVALITGITGTIGSRIAHRLVAEGMQVRGLVRRPAPDTALTALGVEWVTGDITNPETLHAAMQGVDLVIHSAAYIGPDQVVAEATNVEGTRNVVAAALQARPALFVHVSTISVYDLYNETNFDESSPLCPDPRNVYQATKTTAEHLVWAAAEQGLPVTVIRPCNVLGVHPTSTWGPLMVQRIAAGFDRWHPDSIFPWIHVENLVDLLLLAIRSPEAVGQAYTAIDGHVTGREYYGRIAGWLGRSHAEPTAAPFRWQFALAKNRALGHSPRITFEAAMGELEQHARASGLIS